MRLFMSIPPISLKPGLYVTATPIGNLGDITFRAIETMKHAALILCEDTRQTAKLCAAYEIKTPRAPYHDHNAARVRPEIIKKLQEGAAVCLVSDAGTPLISDPGYKLVRAARDAGIDVIPIPGPSAAITALCVAGAPSDQFFFAGFLPVKNGAREKALGDLATIHATLIFYETAPRLAASLAAMAAALGERRVCVGRELTKHFEEFREGRLSDLAADYEAAAPKGEVVVIVFPPEKRAATSNDMERFLKNALAEEMSVKQAAHAAAATLGVKRNDAYAMALQLKGRK